MNLEDSRCERMWVPVRIMEFKFGTIVNPRWDCASDSKSGAWWRLINWYAQSREDVSEEAKSTFTLPWKHSAAVAALRRRGYRLLSATISLNEVHAGGVP